MEFASGGDLLKYDIKLENLLLDPFGCVKIADFGVAAVVQPEKKLHDHCGTPSYIAPEILQDAGYDGFPVDVWSSGIALYAMLCGRLPFKGKSMSELKRCILRGRYQCPEHLSAAAQQAHSAEEAEWEHAMARTCSRVAAGMRAFHAWWDSLQRGVELMLAAARREGVEARQPFSQSFGPNRRLRNECSGSGAQQEACSQAAFNVAEGRVDILQNDMTRAVLHKAGEYGFSSASTEDSVTEGKFDHATATFHLLAQQVVRARAQNMQLNVESSSGDPRPHADDDCEAHEELFGTHAALKIVRIILFVRTCRQDLDGGTDDVSTLIQAAPC
eukprot:g14013.t1